MTLYKSPVFRLGDAGSRRALWRYWLRDPLAGLRDAATQGLLRPLPSEAVSAFGGRLGRLHGAGRKETSVTIQDLFRRLRPDVTPEERAAMEAALWEHLGRVVAELCVLDRLWREGRIEVEGSVHLTAARDAGRPLLFAGMHVGNWEAAAAGLIGLGLPLAWFYQALPSRFDTLLALKSRTRMPVRMLHPVPSSAVAARRILAHREAAVLMFVDEYVGGRVHAPALGREARAEGNIHRLVRMAALTGAVVLPVHALRLGQAARFRLVVGPEVPMLRLPRDPGALAADQAVLDGVVDAAVRAHPEQWLMATSFRWDR